MITCEFVVINNEQFNPIRWQKFFPPLIVLLSLFLPALPCSGDSTIPKRKTVAVVLAFPELQDKFMIRIIGIHR